MEDFCLDFLKYQENPAGFYAPNHYHACCELVYYLSGSGEYTLGGQHFNYQSHTFALIPPRMAHDERAFTDSQLIFIGFRYFDVDISLQPGSYSDFDDAFVCRMLRAMEREIAEKQPLYSAMLNAMTQQLIISLVRKYFSIGTSTHDQSIQYIRKYIDEHFKERMSLLELANMSGYSYDWFRHVFKEQTGHSLTQYIILQRLRHAANQLVTTDKSVTQIAFENNFASSSQFISQFRRHNGATPSEYRKNATDKNTVTLENF
jgi:AraC family transcriptional activator of pobA